MSQNFSGIQNFYVVVAGADLIMTNTYQASVGGFVQYLGLTEEQSLKLITNAVELARKAIDKFMNDYPDSRKLTKP